MLSHVIPACLLVNPLRQPSGLECLCCRLCSCACKARAADCRGLKDVGEAGELPSMDCYGLLWLGYYYYYGLSFLGTRITMCFSFIMFRYNNYYFIQLYYTMILV